MTNALVRAQVQSSSSTRSESWVWTSPDGAGVSADMDDADAIDSDLIELVVQLCTRIGMIMEAASPPAINASRDGLEGRVAEILAAIHKTRPLANAV